MSFSKCLRRLSFIVIVVSVFSIVGQGFAQASVPMMINYQGLLSGRETGEPLRGTDDVVFRIYSHLTGNSPTGLVWSERHSGVEVVRGIFSVILGSGNPLSAAYILPPVASPR